MTKPTLPVTITAAIANQRTAWKTAKAAASELAAFTQESDRKLCGCAPGTDTAGDIAKLAQKNAENTAFRAEYATLAEAKTADLSKKVESTTEAARQLMRTDTARPLNEAVAVVRARRVGARMDAIRCGIASWSAGRSTKTAAEVAHAVIAPALQTLQEKHRIRHHRESIREAELNWPTVSPGDTDQFLSVLATADPSVEEVDRLPVLAGPHDTISEEEFETVSKFLESLPADETTALS